MRKKLIASYSNMYGNAIVGVKSNVSINRTTIRVIKKDTGAILKRCRYCKSVQFSFGKGISIRMYKANESLLHTKGCKLNAK